MIPPPTSIFMKKILRMSLLAVALLAAFVSTSRADITPEKEAEIRKMINTIGLSRLMNQMMDQIMASIQANAPKDLPQEFWGKIHQKIRVDDLIEKVIPVYDKYFSLDDLKAVNAFYTSPAGQHILAVMPQAMRDSTVIGQQWGQKLGEDIGAEILAEQQKMSATKQ
jgi:hypothetical protein